MIAAMTYEFYKVLHLAGILAVFMSLGGILLHTLQGGPKQFASRSWLMMFHGLGLLVIFIAGFGLIAKSHVQTPWPGWLWMKLLIWIVLGMITMFIARLPSLARGFWILILALGGSAAYLAIMKPF